MAIVKVIVMARTMRGETLSKGLRELHYRHSGDKGDTAHVQKGSLWVKSQGIKPGINESCSSQKTSLSDAHPGEAPTVGQMWKKKPDN